VNLPLSIHHVTTPADQIITKKRKGLQFKFNAGFSNAVKRPVYIHDFLQPTTTTTTSNNNNNNNNNNIL
jgi:hypothetical protein